MPKEYSNDILLNFELLQLSYIFTDITVGTPSKTIKAYIQFKYYQYFIVDKLNLNFYSKDLSTSFIPNPKYEIDFKDSLFSKGYYCTETFIFKNITNEDLKIEKLATIIAIETNLDYPCYLGFNFYKDESLDIHENFIDELKKSKQIEFDIFFFEFFNDNKGEIKLGDLPHKYNSSFYNEKHLKWNYIYLDQIKKWNIFFTQIFFGNKIFKGSTLCYLEYELNMIHAPNEYKQLFIETFIEDNKNKCDEFINKNNHSFFICDINVNYKNFPIIIFNSKEFNFKFELNYKDLFFEINGKLYFLVDFNNNSKNFNGWRLGFPFLKKYKFLFNFSKKSIGFYNNKDNKKFFSFFLIFILLIVIIICLLIIIYNIKYTKRKKRVNEIEVNYDYFNKII